MDNLRKKVSNLIKEAVSLGDAKELHRCMNGKMVPFGSKVCVLDIDRRIDDAMYHRDECPGRTDSREHYNGILKVLRRKLRRAKKEGMGGLQ